MFPSLPLGMVPMSHCSILAATIINMVRIGQGLASKLVPKRRHADCRKVWAASTTQGTAKKNGSVEPVATWIIVWFLSCCKEVTHTSPYGLAAVSQDLWFHLLGEILWHFPKVLSMTLLAWSVLRDRIGIIVIVTPARRPARVSQTADLPPPVSCGNKRDVFATIWNNLSRNIYCHG